MRRALEIREAPIVVFTFMVGIFFSLMSSSFYQMDNVELILSQITTNGIVAIGMTMVILLGGIDLSVGSVLALVATSVGLFISQGLLPWQAALLGIGIGVLCGIFNGYFIAVMNIPDIIVTLATMFIFRGLAVGISGGTWMTNFPAAFQFFGQGTVLGISFPLLMVIFFAVLFALALRYTPFGRRVYAIGGNKSAAKLAGMSIAKTKFMVYVYSGILASVSAIIFASKVGSVQASTAGNNLSFEVMAAVLIGGGSIFGGVGTIVGTMFGVLLMGMIKNGLVIAKISPFWVDATIGFLIILAIVINTLQRIRQSKKREGDLV
ncbi:branched-chain amino acid ABC transporter permease [Paenibacillus darwinianus]|uniref:Branched-chain amino acid ABC transporter permease n=1 Tax=Paenibacillus darwinianus TaxID=1380763 RepID=A0A9W5S2U9_9BACL|nr:ABC transporter permease [Paenibacillus darwinianus]EXX91665.1 branched-chain amino acid ABC transporter permease [Paenibacillus darwinianus]EXX91808.1 branched-chain amino acid ABC transporter permease [Paenibacillus darwinianus]EXX92420.1 branched-chain amino acid ABC transporter permease [Paenibacillus darwinianus]